MTFTAEELERRRDEARFPLLAANLRRTDGSYFARPYLLRKVGGTTVGIVGLAYPNTALTSSSKNVGGLVFGDAIRAAEEIVPRLRNEGAEVVIALTHLGLSRDQELARRVPGSVARQRFPDLAECMSRHRHGEWLRFLRMIERSVPKNKDIHIIADNCVTHKHPNVRR